ncbi:MAG: N-acetylmuramoyl-L-alanine amidase [Oscillospiraceae bacterium]|nr:N-acetylmuramoyl-L-alanine amidase [Oscillospiraceae bacterium]
MKKLNISKRNIIIFIAILLSIIAIFLSIFLNNNIQSVAKDNSDDTVNVEESKEESSNNDNLNIPIKEIRDGVRSFYLRAGIDFFQKDTMKLEEVSIQIEDIIKTTVEYGFTDIMIDLFSKDDVIYQSENLKSKEFDILKILQDKADQNDIKIHIVFDLYNDIYFSNLEDPDSQNKSILLNNSDDIIYSEIVDIISKYNINSILIDNYYPDKENISYHEYMSSGGSTGYDNWIKIIGNYKITKFITSVKESGLNVPIGIYLDSVYKNDSTGNNGSKTSSDFQSVVDGNIDILSILEDNIFDFAIIKNFNSITNKDIPYETVLNWWDDILGKLENPIPYYVMHDGNKVVSNSEGWGGTDQLIRQVSTALKLDGYRGSFYKGYNRFKENIDGSTTALIKFYSNEYDEKHLFKDLEITSPKERNIKIFEESIVFSGKFDPNFDVYINGEKIIPTADGEFYIQFPLTMGDNKFEIKHKGQIVNYIVNRTLKLFEDVNPKGNISVEGDSEIDVEAIVHKDSIVNASLGGKSVKLTEVPSDDNVSSDSVYIRYAGKIKVKSGTSKKQNIGNISFSASNQGVTENRNGGSITIDPIYTPPAPPPGTGGGGDNGGGDTGGGDTGGGGNVGGILDPNAPGWTPTGNHKMIRTTRNYADIFSSKSTSSYAPPNIYQWPKDTIDYYVKENTIGSTKYYITRTGKRIKASESQLYTAKDMGYNALNHINTSNDGTSTFLNINQTWKAPFDISFEGVGETTTVPSFNTKSVIITFDYATVAGNMNFSGFGGSSLFKSGRIEKTISNNIPQYKLHLTLKKPGSYFGATSAYDGNGNLILRFHNSRTSLSGARIFVDPGHGNGDIGASGSYVSGGNTIIVRENALTWKMANEVAQQLRAKGAVVKIIDTQSTQNYLGAAGLRRRVDEAQAFLPHAAISVHYNSASVTTATGVETYYNVPFSMPLAKSINDRLANYYHGTLYSDGKNRNRGHKFSEFYVTRVKTHPSVLVEYGFINNPTELQKLNQTTHIQGLAKATVQGLLDFLTR